MHSNSKKNLPPSQNGNFQLMSTDEEFVELQKKMRNAEQDNKAYSQETQSQLKKQKAIIDKLELDNQLLKEELVNLFVTSKDN